jgi:hypothetical protein
VDAYDLDPALALRSKALKRRSFPFAFLGMITMLGIIALGAASDPGASLASPAAWVTPHFVAAWVGSLIIAGAFYFQVIAIGENYRVINQILEEAHRIRSSAQASKPSPESTISTERELSNHAH